MGTTRGIQGSFSEANTTFVQLSFQAKTISTALMETLAFVKMQLKPQKNSCRRLIRRHHTSDEPGKPTNHILKH